MILIHKFCEPLQIFVFDQILVPKMLPVDKVDFFEIYSNYINILAMQALFVMKFSPYTLKITQITIMFKLFSNHSNTEKSASKSQ